jgi:DNA-binding transcriptional regulator LsrR (DeoR family)
MTATSKSIRWTERRIRLLIELREGSGLTHPEIAERLGVTREQVDHQAGLLLRDGRLEPRSGMVAPRDRNRGPRSWETVRRQLKQLYVTGEAHRAMAHQLNLTRIQVHRLRHLFREGLPKR